MTDIAQSYCLSFPTNIDHAKKSLVLSNYEERIRIEGIPPSLGVALLKRINDGGTINDAGKGGDDREVADTAAAISAADDSISGLEGAAAERFLRTLVQEKIAARPTRSTCTGHELRVILDDHFAAWNTALFSHSLWTSLAEGSARPAVVDGWLIESYHFIRGANARLSYAASLCPDPRIKAIFAHHYVEEYDHYEFFAQSLRARAIDVDDVDRQGPLAATRAVLNMARKAARTDPIAYAACSGLMESTGSDADRARTFYGKVAEHFDKSGSGFVRPMIAHVNLDEKFEHGSVMADVLDPIPVLTVEHANRVLQTVFQFKETLMMWFSEVQTHYHRNPFKGRALYRHGRGNPPE
ncbi:iron-containing redox enzyme family protein [Breoghania sp. JC706]|uniref:iron-containing redox enzyme family protein n=1 Tax=Breoghania sp. JC706 TaxID=3117732 RepID=UPI003008CD39